MAKRVSTHCGRKTKKGVFSSRHNDRNFDLKNAPHIDPEKTKYNFYYNFLTDNFYQEEDRKKYETFKESEDNFYKNNFSDWLNKSNQKHIKSRHKERMRSMRDIQKNDRYAPEEITFQIGNKDNFDEEEGEIFVEAIDEYLTWFKHEYGENVQLLNCGYHVDETTPHFHIRQVYLAHDQNGDLMPNQTKALEELKIQRPDPTKKKTRYNNPKMTFTQRNREKLIEICKEKGLQIETEVENPSVKHKDLLEYKTQKIQENIEKGESELDDIFMEKMRMKKDLNKYKKENEALKKTIKKQKDDIKELENKRKDLQELNDKCNTLQDRYNILKDNFNKEKDYQEDVRNAINGFIGRINERDAKREFITEKGLWSEFLKQTKKNMPQSKEVVNNIKKKTYEDYKKDLLGYMDDLKAFKNKVNRPTPKVNNYSKDKGMDF